MIETILVRKNLSLKMRITVKTLISIGIVALAVVLPLLVHLALGQSGGVQWLPMYLPVLLGGCLLGTWWGLGIGIASPLAGFLITSAFGSPMPAAARLPFIMAELAVFASVSGLFFQEDTPKRLDGFSRRLAGTGRRAERVSFCSSPFFKISAPFTVGAVWSQIQAGLLGMLLQAVVVPFLVMGLKFLLDRDKKND